MLSQVEIMDALEELSNELGNRKVMGELNIVGGAAMVLAFKARPATKDVDAIFEPSSEVRAAAAAVAQQLQLPPDWLNDSAKGYLSPMGDFVALDTTDLPNLRIQFPVPEYMLAMKVLAARSAFGDEQGDASDIEFLIRLLRLHDAMEVMAIVGRYYDASLVPPRSVYLVEEILEKLNA